MRRHLMPAFWWRLDLGLRQLVPENMPVNVRGSGMPCKRISERWNQLVVFKVTLRLLDDMIIFYLEEHILQAQLLSGQVQCHCYREEIEP